MNNKYFLTVIEQFEEKERNALHELLSKWECCTIWEGCVEFQECNHKKLVDNIRNEHFLAKDSFYEILNYFLSNSDKELSEVLNLLRSNILENYILKGGNVIKKPAFLATCVKKNILENYLLKNNYTLNETERFFQKDPAEFNVKEKKTLLKFSNRLIWVTWDEFDEVDPYNFLHTLSVDAICDAMALDKSYRNKQLALLYFMVDPNRLDQFPIYRPTWCDANFFDKFSPTDPSKEIRWGQTSPTVQLNLKPNYQERRPEGVVLSNNLPCEYLNRRIKIIHP